MGDIHIDPAIALIVTIVGAICLLAVVLTSAPVDPKPKRWFYLPEKKVEAEEEEPE